MQPARESSTARTARDRAPVREIFSSVQGEGVFVGRRQIFFRLEGCDLACDYCDTPAGFRDEKGKLSSRGCRVETEPGTRRFREIANPVSTDDAVREIAALERAFGPHWSVSFTGGEPLLHDRFLGLLLPRVKQEVGLKVFLETAGHHPEIAEALAPWIDIVSMDVKLPLGREGNVEGSVYPRFLTALSGRLTQVKIVVKASLSEGDLREGIATLAGFEHLPLILQPVTPYGRVTEADVPTPAHLLRLQRVALERLREVRVIPQMHKLMGQM